MSRVEKIPRSGHAYQTEAEDEISITFMASQHSLMSHQSKVSPGTVALPIMHACICWGQWLRRVEKFFFLLILQSCLILQSEVLLYTPGSVLYFAVIKKMNYACFIEIITTFKVKFT